MRLSDLGKMVQEVWENLPRYRPNIDMDVFVVMPNHLHGIVVVQSGSAPGGRTRTSAPTKSDACVSSLSEVVQRFKTYTTKQYQKAIAPLSGPLWQRDYYEHVVRDEADLSRVREYIVNNPLQWHLDHENPDRA